MRIWLKQFLLLALAACCAACSVLEEGGGFSLPVPESAAAAPVPQTFDLRNPEQAEQLALQLAGKRAIFIGEIHDKLDHHQNQLRMIAALYRRDPRLAIGVEYFQQPFQPHLDDYLEGRIGEAEMLSRTEYYQRWQLDYRQLRPIVEFARANGIPLLALNISDEIHNKVFRGGVASLSAAEKAQLPQEVLPAAQSYRDRLQAIFNSHPVGPSFDNFVQGQLLWDESMAERAAHYLREHPGYRIAILAGSGHMIYGNGIPERINKRLGGEVSAVLLNGDEFGEFGGIADYLLTTRNEPPLPPSGKLGVALENRDGGVRINDFTGNSAAQAEGVAVGDYIVTIDDSPVHSIAELKSVMYAKKRGDKVRLGIRREHGEFASEELQFAVTLR